MRLTAQQKEQREQSAQFARYKKAHKTDRQALLDGEYAKPFERLLAILKRLPDSAVELVEHLDKGWIDGLTGQQRMTVLDAIDTKIIRLRELDGLPPFDDPRPGDEPNLFLTCRKIIMGF